MFLVFVCFENFWGAVTFPAPPPPPLRTALIKNLKIEHSTKMWVCAISPYHRFCPGWTQTYNFWFDRQTLYQLSQLGPLRQCSLFPSLVRLLNRTHNFSINDIDNAILQNTNIPQTKKFQMGAAIPRCTLREVLSF